MFLSIYLQDPYQFLTENIGENPLMLPGIMEEGKKEPL